MYLSEYPGFYRFEGSEDSLRFNLAGDDEAEVLWAVKLPVVVTHLQHHTEITGILLRELGEFNLFYYGYKLGFIMSNMSFR